MYPKPTVPGVIGGGAIIPVTGFFTGSLIIMAVIFIILGGVLVRMSYLKRAEARET